MYYLIGVLGTIVGAFLTYAILTFAYGEGYGAFVNMDTFYLNMTLFLAYASMFPEMEVYLYMILPIKVKWLGYLDGLYLIYIFLSSGFTVAGISVKVSIVAALLNFLLFFFSMKKIRRMGANFKAKTIHKKKARAYKAKTITPKKKNVRCTNVQCATEQNLTIQNWNFVIVQNAMGIMNIVKIIYLPISM